MSDVVPELAGCAAFAAWFIALCAAAYLEAHRDQKRRNRR